MARSRFDAQYEQPRMARSRFGSQYEQPRVVRSRLGPQYEQPKMGRSRPNPHHTLDSRFESIRRPRMMRPLVTETGKWVTLEPLGLNQSKHEYKYGYNPYFSRMTRTQRQRWIRQQAALHQEFGKRDHYSFGLTTDSNSMEVITGAEAPKYLRRLYVGKEDITGATTKNTIAPIKNGTSHKVQNTETKPCQDKDSTRTQDNHKHLEKNNDNVKSEIEYEEAKTSQVLVRPQKGQMVQVWFDIKKRSPRGMTEAEDNQIEEKQS